MDVVLDKTDPDTRVGNEAGSYGWHEDRVDIVEGSKTAVPMNTPTGGLQPSHLVVDECDVAARPVPAYRVNFSVLRLRTSARYAAHSDK